MTQVTAALVCVALLGITVGCRERAAKQESSELGTRRAEPAAHVTRARPGTTAIARTDTAVAPGAVATVPAAPVDLWRGPGARPFEVALRTGDPASAMSRRFGRITLRTSLRSRAADLGQYPCTSCHLGRRIVLADDRVADAHQNIEVSHPRQTGGTCSTCHSADNVELLTLKSGERASLDHTYRLCAQCHFSQAEAWAAGAHGKRLDGWQGRRVLMGCADCHDPHHPALEPRVPFRGPRIERIKGSGK